MITLEHVRLLESRVGKALECIDRLRSENSQLKGSLTSYEKRIQDLESLVQDFQTDQGRIEEGIIHAIEKLNTFEESEFNTHEEVKEATLSEKLKIHHAANSEVGHGAHIHTEPKSEPVLAKIESEAHTETDKALNPSYWEQENHETALETKVELQDTVLNVVAEVNTQVSSIEVTKESFQEKKQIAQAMLEKVIENDSDIASGELDIF